MENKTEQRKQSRLAIPGDRLATIEEFVPGSGSASLGDAIVSTVVGNVQPDMANRVINVKAVKSADNNLPKVGDLIIGHVDSSQPSMAQITIIAVNDQPSDKQLKRNAFHARGPKEENVQPDKSWRLD